MWLLLLITSTIIQYSRQHVYHPMNFCMMSASCVHDGRPVCAMTPEGCKRSFLDQCDLYEYNCDFGTQFQRTYYIYCMSPNGPHCLPSNKGVRRPRPTVRDDRLNEILPYDTFGKEIYNPHYTVTVLPLPPCKCPVPYINCCEKPVTQKSTPEKMMTPSVTTSFIVTIPLTTTISKTTRKVLSPSTFYSTYASKHYETPRLETTTKPTTSTTTTTKATTTKSAVQKSVFTKSTTKRTPTKRTTTKSTTTKSYTTKSTATKITTTKNTTSGITTKKGTTTKSTTAKSITTQSTISKSPTTRSTTTKSTTMKSTNTRSTTRKGTTTTIEIPTTSKNLPTAPSKTTYKLTTSSIRTTECCDRPKSWDTTTENIKAIIFTDVEKKSSDEYTKKQTDSSSSEADISESAIVTTSPGTITPKLSIISKTTLTLPLKSNKSSTNSETICCNRPLTWETTSEMLKILFTNFMDVETKRNTSPRTSTILTVPELIQSTVMSITHLPKSATSVPITTRALDKTSTLTMTSRSTVSVTTMSSGKTSTLTLKPNAITFNATVDHKARPVQTTSKKKTTVTLCCDRPKTWETASVSIFKIITDFMKSSTELTTIPFSTKIQTKSTPTTTKTTTTSLQTTTSPPASTTTPVKTITPTVKSTSLYLDDLTYVKTDTVHMTNKQNTPDTDCCELPKTWETTAVNTGQIVSISNEPTTKVTKPSFSFKTSSSTSHVKMTKPKTSTTESDVTVTSTVTVSFNTTVSAMPTKATTSITECCNNPVIWETTPIIWKIYSTIPSTSVDTKTTSTIKTTTTTRQSENHTTLQVDSLSDEILITNFTDKVTSESTEKDTSEIEISKNTHDSQTTTSSTKSTIYTLKSSVKNIYEEHYDYYFSSNEHRRKKTKSTPKTQSTTSTKSATQKPTTNDHGYQDKTTWWYPNVCKPGQCHIPVTWETTVKKRKKKQTRKHKF